LKTNIAAIVCLTVAKTSQVHLMDNVMTSPGRRTKANIWNCGWHQLRPMWTVIF